jgi:hypothetical protein
VSWDHLGISREFHRALLHRDDSLIADLDPEALSYDDPGVPVGHHTYRLDTVLVTDDGQDQRLDSMSCEVDVLFASSIQCQVFGGIAIPPQLLVTWEPPPSELSVLGIEVHRDGEIIATLPADASEYSEEPIQGEHRYTIIAVTAVVKPVEPPPPNELVLGDCLVSYEPPVIGGFIRADSNGDDDHNLSDAVFTLVYLFAGGPEPGCLKSADVDDSGVVELTDAVYDLSYLFLGGRAPIAPFPNCGHDATPDELSCELYPRCFTPPPP